MKMKRSYVQEGFEMDIKDAKRFSTSIVIGILVVSILLAIVGKALGEEPSPTLLRALIVVESHNNDYAIGDRGQAFGCLQIWQAVCDDVNRRHGTDYQATNCLGNDDLSVLICRRYINMWATEQRLGRKPTNADKARIWNGGPVGCFDNGALDKNGRLPKSDTIRQRIAKQQQNTKCYWRKVQLHLKN